MHRSAIGLIVLVMSVGDVEAAEDRAIVPAVARAVAILDALVANGGDPMSSTQLARQLNIPKSSTINLCRQLTTERLLRRVDGLYALGPKLTTLGAVCLASIDTVREFRDVCASRGPECDQTVKLATLGDHGDVIYLARHDSGRPSTLVIDVRVQQPAHCTATGKAMLACLSEPEFEHWISSRRNDFTRPTANSIGSESALRSVVRDAQVRGYAIDDEECIEGVFCVGTALGSRNTADDVLGLSFALLKQRASSERVAELADEVRLMALELAARLGNGYVPLSGRTTRKPPAVKR